MSEHFEAISAALVTLPTWRSAGLHVRCFPIGESETLFVVPRRILVVTTAAVPEAQVGAIVRAHAGEDAEVHVVAPASKISWLDRLTNAEDDARSDAADRAEAASEAVPGEQVEAHVGDVDPLQAIEDALRLFPAEEVVVLTAPDEQGTWLETGLGEEAQKRLSVPVTHLVTG